MTQSEPPPRRALHWGVIATGGIAADFVADLALTDSGEVVAVGSRRIESAETFADRFDIPRRHGSYEALAADPDVDAVYVATPHPGHHAAAMLALRAGKAVLVEKPFTMNGAQARELVSVSREQGVFLMEAMWTRFLPHIVEVRRLLAEQALGEIVTVSADHGQWFEPDPHHRLFAPELGGGALLDLGVYAVSFASMVLGPPERILAMSDPAFTGVDAQTSMLLGYASGAHALLTCTLRAKSSTRAAIVGTEARIEIDGSRGGFYRPTSFTLISRSGAERRYDLPHEGHGLRHQADEVTRCVAEGLIESPAMPLDETISIMETMDAVLARAASDSPAACP